MFLTKQIAKPKGEVNIIVWHASTSSDLFTCLFHVNIFKLLNAIRSVMLITVKLSDFYHVKFGIKSDFS